MPEAFDPYYTWLAIAPKDQPPNHYRLLGVDLFEPNPTVVEHAADQRMAHLRTFQTGRNSAFSQRLLNEVSAARLCLLDAKKKAAYDEQLHRLIDAATAGEDTSSHERLLRELGEMADEALRSARRPARRMPIAAIVVAIVVVAVAILAWFANRRVGRVPTSPTIAATTATSPLPLAGEGPGVRAVSAATASPAADPAHTASAPEPKSPATAARDMKPAEAVRPVVLAEAAKAAGQTDGGTRSARPTLRSAEPAKPIPQPVATTPAPTSQSSPPALTPAVRLAVPDEAAQQAALKVAQDIFRADYDKAKSPAQKQALAGKILEQANAAELTPADRYVLLRLARDVAAQCDAAKLSFEAIDRMAEKFPIDPLPMKAEALATAVHAAKGQAGHKAAADQAVELAGEALTQDNIDVALQLSKLAQTEAAKTRDRETVLKVRNLAKEVQDAQKAFAEVQAAMDTLKQRPDDPEANLVAGRYYALVRRDWEKGLPYLAKGSDEKLKALGLEDLKHPPPIWKPAAGVPPPDPLPASVAIKLADAWWDLGQAAKGKEREGLLWRAGWWYQEVAAGPQAAEHSVKLEKRQQALAKLGVKIPPKKLLANSIGMRFVLIPAGQFEMGSTPDEIAREVAAAKTQNTEQKIMDCMLTAKPRHLVRITKPFYLGIYEVTQAEYRHVTNSNPSAHAPGGSRGNRVVGQDADRHPVDSVSWVWAMEYCHRLTSLDAEQRAGRAYRLPTEAEWEYVCRAGSITRWHSGNDEASLADYAWTYSNSRGMTHPVGQKKPNAWGLYDMHGNLLEWCTDWFDPEYYQRSPASDPPGPQAGKLRVTRGGSYATAPPAGSDFRFPDTPHNTGLGCGFRVVADCAH